MRLMTYNIHGCIGADGKKDPARILSVIEESGADVIALQEVHNEAVEDKSFLKRLEALPYACRIFGPTLERRGADYGNVLLARFPSVTENLVDLSVARREPRGAITAHLHGADVDILVIATHLGLSPFERKQQIELLAASIESQRADAGSGDLRVLMGDLNEWRDGGRTVRRCHKLYSPVRTVRTFPSRFPIFPLDRIWVAPDEWTMTSYALKTPLTRVASDHLPLVVDVRAF
jgi:endonuclease/exonuclease/phosphatase family metal-dependent hydrolase